MLRTLSLSLALLSLSACSAFLMNQPGASGSGAATCDPRRKLPAIDVALSLANLGAGAVGTFLITREEEGSYRVVALAAVVTANATAVILHGASAGKGFQWARRCRVLQRTGAEEHQDSAEPMALAEE